MFWNDKFRGKHNLRSDAEVNITCDHALYYVVATAQIFDSICVRPLCTYSGLRFLTFKSLTDLLNAFKKLLSFRRHVSCYGKHKKRPEVIVLTFDQSQENTKIWYEYGHFNQHLYQAFPFPRKAWLQVKGTVAQCHLLSDVILSAWNLKKFTNFFKFVVFVGKEWCFIIWSIRLVIPQKSL